MSSEEQKKLQKDSVFDKLDTNKDGVVSDDELQVAQVIEEMEIKEEKAEAQKNMAWVSLVSIICFTVMVFLPVFPDSRIKVLADLSALFYISMAGVCGAYMGMSAYMSRR
tara:strand:- start:95 stop:424 length:330 start_codon:yes stop_codon:yes gene_type:complete